VGASGSWVSAPGRALGRFFQDADDFGGSGLRPLPFACVADWWLRQVQSSGQGRGAA